MTDTPFTCIDRVIPLELTTEAYDIATQIRAENATPNGEAAGVPRRYWKPGATLTVRFLDSPELADRVLEIAGGWMEHANLHLQQVTHGDADIRITFEGAGNWSALGTEARLTRYFPADGPTMCLSEVTHPESPRRLRRVVLHEFGHAIGLIHEHQSPAADIDWNKAAVYADLAGPPNHWDRATVHTNIFRRYSGTTTNSTAFDELSIMLYQLPAEWTSGQHTYPDNTELSRHDVEFVEKEYPR